MELKAKVKKIKNELLDNGVVPFDLGYSGRADKFLADVLKGWSRSMVDELIANDAVKINSQIIDKGSKRLKKGDKIELESEKFTAVLNRLKKEIKLQNFGQEGGKEVIEPQDIPIDSVYENENVLIVNKPAGMVVHPAAGNYKDTLVNAVAGYFQRNDVEFPTRVGMVHRIDKDVSGLILFAKNDWSLSLLSRQFSGEAITPGNTPDLSLKALKKYLAVVGPCGMHNLKKADLKFNKWGKIEGYIRRNPHNRHKFEFSLNKPFITDNKGRYCLSYMRIKRKLPNDSNKAKKPYWLLEVQIVTGRTHQIRAQLARLGLPIVGDIVYGGRSYESEEADFSGIRLQSTCMSYIPPMVYDGLGYKGKCFRNTEKINVEEVEKGSRSEYRVLIGKSKRSEASKSGRINNRMGEIGDDRYAGFFDRSVARKEVCLDSIP